MNNRTKEIHETTQKKNNTKKTETDTEETEKYDDVRVKFFSQGWRNRQAREGRIDVLARTHKVVGAGRETPQNAGDIFCLREPKLTETFFTGRIRKKDKHRRVI